MSVSSRRGRGVVGLVATAFAAVVLAVSANAAAPVNGLTFAVKVPPAGSVSWLFVRLDGTLKPGATLPAHLDLRQLGEVANAAALPKGLAVYAAARVGRSGSTIAIRELLVVLNPRSAVTRKKASAEQERSPTVTVKEPSSGSALDMFGALLRWQQEKSQASEPVLRPTKLLLADEPDILESPDPIIASTPLSVAGVTLADLGSWEDGHAFGWKVKGSPAGSTNAAAVVNDLDATVTEFIRLVNNPTDYEKAFIEATIEADTARLARDAALPTGSLELAPPASATTPAAGAATTGGGAAKIVVVDDKASFGGVVCAPGGGSLELSWLIHGAQPGATLVVAMTGPGVPPEVRTTVGANGAASAVVPVTGSGTWTDTLISVGGKKPSGATNDHAQETCG